MPVGRFGILVPAFLALLILLASLVTAAKAFVGALITPLTPYDVPALAADIPRLTAVLNLDFFFFTPTLISVYACSNRILSILPRSSADSKSCCPGCVCSAP